MWSWSRESVRRFGSPASKIQVQTKLHAAHILLDTRDMRCHAGRSVDAGVRIARIIMIERVEDLPPKYQALALRDLEILVQRKIGHPPARAGKHAQSGRSKL